MSDSSSTTPQARREASEVIAEHLPAGYGTRFDGNLSNVDGTASPARDQLPQQSSEEESSLTLQGGDIHRDLFKTAARAKMHNRRQTYHPDSQPVVDDDEDFDPLSVSNQLAPGGFRRAFLQQQQRPNFLAARVPVARNFVEFLDLFGSFAGEDLADSDDEAIVTDEEGEEEDQRPAEARPLLGRRKSSHAPRSHDASMMKTFFTLLKAFIGTGIMFLPKAFSNGGLLFSSITLLLVAAISMLSFHLLLSCKSRVSGGYGEIGAAIVGPRMRGLILSSITLSQLGFVCAGIVFVAENMMSFCEAMAKGTSPLSTTTLILLQLLILIPLALIRNISKLGIVALLADVCIMIGVFYIYYFDISTLAARGIHKTVVLFNPEQYTLMIGAAIFTFEGIGLILPIQSSMAQPHRFEYLLGLVMVIITVIFASVGALCYATFGTNTYIEIIDNFPQDNKFVNAVQFLYSLAVLVGTPVQLFPAVRIIENKIFGYRSGKRSVRTKWVKNAFRTFLVVFCGGISIIGAGNLDRFVALIGSFACVPLVYIYPPYLHYRAVASSWPVKAVDIVFMALGLVCMVYTTIVTIVNSFLH